MIRRWWVIAPVVVALGLTALLVVVLTSSGATLAPDDAALARVSAQAFGGRIEQASASDSHGHPIALDVHAGRLTPRAKLTPGELVSVDVVLQRPGWIGWAIGSERHERLTIRAPVAHLTSRWITVAQGAPVRLAFDRAVSDVSVDATRDDAFERGSRTVSLRGRQAAGSVSVAVAARSWERLGAPVTASWFPRADGPVAIVSPAPGAKLSPATPIRITFSQPVSEALGSQRPHFSTAVPGAWHATDSHTLQFTPTGLGAGFGTDLRLDLPRTITVTGPEGVTPRATRQIDWTLQQGSTLRLQQLLAQAGYLPLSWSPSGAPVPLTEQAQGEAAVNAPAGSFSWRYANTPDELRRQWTPGRIDTITRGAVMMFQDQHHLAVDAIAGTKVWQDLLADAIAGRHPHNGGYSYVYVHRRQPQKLTLWHNGHTVLTSPGNTGVPAAPTKLGTFPVFEHLRVTTMSGRNPDGSHYKDPGIRWVSYFNGGDALHAFNRASFGTPQSLGCVELPLATAAKVWPYTPIGTLVTIEN
jgi:peptidoglycan hydrolase-like protein with peptidoglycan-binding domain